MRTVNAAKTSTQIETARRIIEGKKFMDQYYLTNPGIKDVARQSNMSEFHFYRCFKRLMGITPYQYLLEKRLKHARQLLTHDKLLITHISAECGFPDVFTFSKAFKRKYGISPSVYQFMVSI